MASILNELIDIAESNEEQIYSMAEKLSKTSTTNEIEEDILKMEKTLKVIEENQELQKKNIVNVESAIDNLQKYKEKVTGWTEGFLDGNDLSEQNETKISARELGKKANEADKIIKSLDNETLEKIKSTIVNLDNAKRQGEKIMQALKNELSKKINQ